MQGGQQRISSADDRVFKKVPFTERLIPLIYHENEERGQGYLQNKLYLKRLRGRGRCSFRVQPHRISKCAARAPVTSTRMHLSWKNTRHRRN